MLGISLLFIQREPACCISLIITKVTNEFLIGGPPKYIDEYIRCNKKQFNLGKIVTKSNFYFNGFEIFQSTSRDITLSIQRYTSILAPIPVSRTRTKSPTEPATAEDVHAYQSLVSVIIYLENSMLPQEAFITSLFQQNCLTFA